MQDIAITAAIAYPNQAAIGAVQINVPNQASYVTDDCFNTGAIKICTIKCSAIIINPERVLSVVDLAFGNIESEPAAPTSIKKGNVVGAIEIHAADSGKTAWCTAESWVDSVVNMSVDFINFHIADVPWTLRVGREG